MSTKRFPPSKKKKQKAADKSLPDISHLLSSECISQEHNGRNDLKLIRTQKPPETADEYLSLGVSHEEAGEKWRGGDAVKAMRFFVRAIDTYNEGLRLFPTSFDLVYNKARIQYDITQRAVMRKQLPLPLIDLLDEALQTHRMALSIEPQNADVLFNTAQVLTSVADAEEEDDLSVGHLEEALRLLQECIMVQEQQYLEGQRLADEQAVASDKDEELGDGGGVPLGLGETESPTAAENDEEQRQWASVLEPVTATAIVETCIAAVDALATICSLVSTSNANALGHLESASQEWLGKTNTALTAIPTLDDEDVQIQARCAVFKLKAALIEVQFRFGIIPFGRYSAGLNELTDQEVAAAVPTWSVLACFADANIEFATATNDSTEAANTRWAKLSKSLDFLSEALKLAPSHDVATIHMGRGDVELLRDTLCRQSGLPPNIANPTVQARLLKNAETHYRNSSTTAHTTAGQREVFLTALIKEALAKCLADSSPDAMTRLNQPGIDEIEIRIVLRELVAQSVVPISSLQTCGLARVLQI